MDRIRERRKRGFALGAGLLALGAGLAVFGLTTDIETGTREWAAFYLYGGGLLLAVAGFLVVERVKRVCRKDRIRQRAQHVAVLRRSSGHRWRVQGHVRHDLRTDRLWWIEPQFRPPW